MWGFNIFFVKQRFAAQIIPKPGTSKQSQEQENALVEDLDKLNISEA